MKSSMIRIGNFLFRYRNQAFPIIILLLFLVAPPPSETLGSTTLARVEDVVAVLVALSGLALRATVIGYAYIQRGGLNKKVYAKNLVTEGVFGICRNPLYVGNLLIYAAVFLMHGDPQVVTTGIASFLFMYQCIIYAEEDYLEGKFGEGYRVYCADVPRWIPRFRKFAEATEGMAFNLKRVIGKDYSTISATLIALLSVEIYEHLAVPEPTAYRSYLLLLAALIALIGLMAGVIRILKKRGNFRESKAV
ncbi:phospholipid methyltransferase [Rhizobium sullae]|uniref:Phospholipid methyltransferase n=2 Tax=Rhizobium sullae TaxID=50338 RepID=A0A2N0D8L5_RHISU|nr:phospholipid methyltransferase [Rhizobium sullae]